jgi:acetyl-CoA synthetase
MSAEPIADLSAQSVIWRPGPAQIDRSRALAFARLHGLDGWDALVDRAAEAPDWFWGAVSDELGLVWTRRYDQVLDRRDGPEWPRWFSGGRMNYVTSAIDRWLPERAEENAVIWEGDDGAIGTLTYAELSEAVNRMANGLRSLGIG